MRRVDALFTFTPTSGSASALYQVQPTCDALRNVLGVTTTLPQGANTPCARRNAQIGGWRQHFTTGKRSG